MEVREPPANYGEYRDLPDDAPRYEIIEGVGYLTPSPGGRHQIVSANLQFHLHRFVRTNRLGRVFDAPFDVVFSERDVVQPDLLFVPSERRRIIRERGVFGPPDLVVEIVSPTNAQRDFQDKLKLYRCYGVREYWIVDIENRSVGLWVSGEGPLDTCRTVTGDNFVDSAVLAGFSIGLAEIFDGMEEVTGDQ